MQVDYVEHYGTDLSVVNAARVSFANESRWEEIDISSNSSDPKIVKFLSDRDAKLVHYLAKHKHTSCFEHQGATLRLKVPIFIARQIQRHRTFSYNEISRRYVDTPPEFFWPEVWRKRADNVKQGSSEEAHTGDMHGACFSVDEAAKGAVGHALNMYLEMIREENGVAPELARMILPQNMYTEFYATSNLRNWSHFLKLRLDGHAQYEVRVVAEMVRDILTPLFPVSMEALMAYD